MGLAIPGGWLGGRIVRTLSVSDGSVPPLAAPTIIFGLFLWAGLMVPTGPVLAASLALGWVLACLATIDLASYRLPNLLTAPLIVAGLAASFALPSAPFLDHLAGAAIGYGALALLAFGYRRLRGVEGIGLGDAKLLAAGGAWLGWRPLPSVVLIACALAFVWIAVRRIRRGPKTLTEHIAFGPPLCLAIWIVWLHGPLTL